MAGTGVAYPADAVSGSPTYTSLNGRNALSAIMAGATASKPLGGISGVRPGTPATTVTATSTTWTAQPFAGYIDLEASNTNSGYFFAFGGVTSGSVNAAGGSARTDIVWVQIADSNTSDGSTGSPRVIVDYTANTTTPPARAFVIAQINVPASGGGSPTVTWMAPVTAAAGGAIQAEALSQLNGISGLRTGTLAQVFADSTSANNLTYRWNGSAWKAWESDWISYTSSHSLFVVGSGGTDAFQYRWESGRVRVKWRLILGSSGFSVSNNPTFSLPVSATAVAHSFEQRDGSGFAQSATVSSFTSMVFASDDSNAAAFRAYSIAPSLTAVTPTSPHTWAAGSRFDGELVFDPA